MQRAVAPSVAVTLWIACVGNAWAQQPPPPPAPVAPAPQPAPVYQQPGAPAPVYQQPGAPAPVYQQPGAPAPVYQQPGAPAPVYQQPGAPAPVYQQPGAPAPVYQQPGAPAPVYQQPGAPGCIPACREGYLCLNGQCVQRCNPPCGAGQMCTDSGACVLDSSGAAGGVASTDLGPKSFAVGLGVGYAFGGTVGVENVGDVDHDGGPLFDAFIDGIIVPAFSMGGYFTYTTMSPKGGTSSVSFFSVGGTIKGRIRVSDAVRIRPGVTLGYNSMNHELWSEATSGFNVGLHLDVAIATSHNFALVPRFGFFSQPVGGNKDFTLTYPPHPYLAFLVEFGK